MAGRNMSMNKPKSQKPSYGGTNYDFSEAYYVVVTGSTPCGHMLLKTRGGWYFHVTELLGYPDVLSKEDYRAYLREEHKKELYDIKVNLPRPDAANRRLHELLNRIWIYRAIHNNCTDFVKEVLR